MSTFNEDDHPREPEGAPDSKGGQFTDKLTARSKFEDAVESIKKTGGFTLQPVTGDVPTDGFAVSIFENESESVPLDRISLNDLIDYAASKGDLFDNHANYFGGWIKDGRVYLDVTIVVKSAAEAEALCLKHDQKAYWDFRNKAEVIVNKDAKSGGAAPP